MKYPLSDLEALYAAKRGYQAFTDMKTYEQTAAIAQINNVYSEIWFSKQRGFSKREYQGTFVPARTVTVTGTAGEQTVTFAESTAASYSGVPTVGQRLVIGNREYRLTYRRSATVWAIDGRLPSALSSDTGKIIFDRYPVPLDVAQIRYVELSGQDDPLPFLDEYLTEIQGVEGTPDVVYDAGVTEQDFLTSGSVNVDQNSRVAEYSGTVDEQHIGMSLVLKVSSAWQIFKVVDIDTATDDWILDRPYEGDDADSVSFALNPAGMHMIAFKPLPTDRETFRVVYTKSPTKLIDDNDTSELPDDTPLMKGVEAVAVAWEKLDSGAAVNEVLYQDKKFKEYLKQLNRRGMSWNMKMRSMEEVTRLRHFPRNTNIWNSWWSMR